MPAVDAKAVDADLLEAILTCPVCHELMHAPCSLMCGHSFCRGCLHRLMRASFTCPMCRCAFRTSRPPRPNTALTSLAAAAFPEAHVAHMERQAEPRLPIQLPLFLSTEVHFPTAYASLNLFEDRYRRLSHDALTAHDDQFAMIYAAGAGGFPLHCPAASLEGRVCTICHIEQHRRTADGRYLLRVRGRERARDWRARM